MAAALALLLGSCGSDESSSEVEDPPITTATPATEPADDPDAVDEGAEDDAAGGEGDGGPASIEIEPLSADELCELLPGEAVGAAVGTEPTEVRAAGNLCEYSFGDYVLRLQEYTGVFEDLDGLRGSGLVGGLSDFLDGAGENPVRIEGVGDGAFQVDAGWVYVATGGNLLLIDKGFGTVPDDFDEPAVFAEMAKALAANL